MTTLKSCPFCANSDAQLINDVCNSNYFVWCKRCGASTGKCYYGQKRKLDLGGKKYPTRESARENAQNRWNMRAQIVKINFKENI